MAASAVDINRDVLSETDRAGLLGSMKRAVRKIAEHDPGDETDFAVVAMLEARERAAAVIPSLQQRSPLQWLEILEQRIVRAKESLVDSQDAASAYRDDLQGVAGLTIDALVALERYRAAHPEVA